MRDDELIGLIDGIAREMGASAGEDCRFVPMDELFVTAQVLDEGPTVTVQVPDYFRSFPKETEAVVRYSLAGALRRPVAEPFRDYMSAFSDGRFAEANRALYAERCGLVPFDQMAHMFPEEMDSEEGLKLCAFLLDPDRGLKDAYRSVRVYVDPRKDACARGVWFMGMVIVPVRFADKEYNRYVIAVQTRNAVREALNLPHPMFDEDEDEDGDGE